MEQKSKSVWLFGRRATATVGAVLVAAVLGGSMVMARQAAAQSAAVDGLGQAIDKVLGDQRLVGAQADVVVRSADSGEVLYSHDANNRLVPASNDKLYSSTAAMMVLGPDHRFATTVSADGAAAGGAVSGNLYLKGGGDPSLQPSDYDALAAQVAAAGIHAVSGQVVYDDTFFAQPRLGDNWAWDNFSFSFSPEISALTVAADSVFDDGSIEVDVRPGAPGQPAQVQTVPATSFVNVVDQATTGAAGSADTVDVERQLGVNTIIVSGSIPAAGGTDSTLTTVSNPAGYAATLFRDSLARHGVAVAGATSAGSTPSGARTVTQRQSAPLSQLLTPFLKRSNNEHAEMLVKAMGQQAQGDGSWPAGLGAVRSSVARLGVDTNAVQLVDGSGLSNLDFISAQQTTNLLIAAQHQSWFSTWYNALPIAGEPDPLVGGTLAARMRNTKAAGNVHAKTGTLTGASALSGYVTDADGERLVFSIMENNYLSAAPKDLEDAIAVDLAGFSRRSGMPAGAAAQARPAPAVAVRDPHGKEVECAWTPKGCA